MARAVFPGMGTGPGVGAGPGSGPGFPLAVRGVRRRVVGVLPGEDRSKEAKILLVAIEGQDVACVV